MKDMTVGDPLRTILRFGLPLYFGTLLQHVYILINSIFVGQYVGSNALAAIGVAGSLIYFIISIVIGIAIGFSILISHLKGENDKAGITTSISMLITLMILLGGIIAAFSPIVTAPTLSLLNVPQEILSETSIYIKTIFYGMIFQFLTIAIISALRGLGDSDTPLFALLASCAINIALDYIFIVYLGWGIFGAAIATVIAQGVALFGLLLYIYFKNEYFRGSLNTKFYDAKILSRALHFGIWPVIQHLILSGGVLILIWIITPFGVAAIAAATIVGRIEMFMVMFFSEMGSSMTTFVGQNFGRKNFPMIKEGFHKTSFFSIVVALLITAGVLFFAEPLVMLFTADSVVIEIASNYLHIIFPFFACLALTNVCHGYLNGFGETKIALLCTLYSFVIARLVMSFIWGNSYGVDGLWWAGSFGWTVGFIYTIIKVYKLNIGGYSLHSLRLDLKRDSE